MRFPFSVLERWEEEVEKVHERARRVAGVLDQSNVPYQVIGGLAVASWVMTADPGAVRATRDVDIALFRADLPRAQAALEEAGYRYRHAAGVDMFLDQGVERASDAIHVIFANEKVRVEYAYPVPPIPSNPPRPAGEYSVIELPALVRMKLTSFRIKDKMHLLDLLGVGLITSVIEATLPADLMARLQELKDNPED